MKQASNKKVCPCEFQGDLMLKKSLSFNQNPGAKKCLIKKDGDKLPLPVNSDAVKKYIVKKNQLAKSQTWKGGLGKNERLGELKTRTGDPGKN